MAMGKTLRNRLVGGFIILSLVLIVLPAMMQEGEKKTSTGNIVAIDKNGAITDSKGQLVSDYEPDYATLLEPQEDEVETVESLPSISKDNKVDLYTSDLKKESPSGDYSTQVAPIDEGAEILIGGNTTKNASFQSASNSEVLKAPTKSKEEVLKAPKKEVLTANTNSSVKTSNASKASSSTADVILGKYSVQVGVFSKAENANNIVKKLKAAGISSYTQNIVSNGKNLIRVYAGSGSSKEALTNTLNQVLKVTGTKGSIVLVK